LPAGICYGSTRMARRESSPSPASGADPQRVAIRQMTYGPHGVGRLPDGKAVFVRGVVPGEQVEVAVIEDRKTFAYADLLDVIEPAADRRQPPCDYLPACGGCPWQHIRYDAQLRAKEQSVRDALARIGKLDAAVVRAILPSPLEFGYRNRLNLRVDGHEVGFYRGATHTLVPIDHCLLAEDEVDQAIVAARELVSRLHRRVRRIEVVARGGPPGVVLHAEIEGDADRGDDTVVDDFIRSTPRVAGVILQGRRWRRAWGDVTANITPAADVSMESPAGVFSQVNPLANRILVETALALGEISESDHVLELYAGAGNLTLPLARRAARVVAVEQNEIAANAAIASMRALQNVEIRVSSAARAVEQIRQRRERFDVFVLDPPRSGAPEVIKDLLEIAPRRIVYVSCNPTTLARDLGRLSARYRVEAVQPIDMFPHTYHVESVARTVLT